jgi:HSP20 family protein
VPTGLERPSRLPGPQQAGHEERRAKRAVAFPGTSCGFTAAGDKQNENPLLGALVKQASQQRAERRLQMSIQYDPFHRLDELRDRLLSGGRAPLGFPMDAYRRGDKFLVHLDLPGVQPDTVEASVENQVLTVTAERGFEPLEGDEFLVSERPHGRFSRQLRLGSTIDTENVAASYEDGVLTLILPVSERAKPRQIPIGRGGPTQIEGGETG